MEVKDGPKSASGDTVTKWPQLKQHKRCEGKMAMPLAGQARYGLASTCILIIKLGVNARHMVTKVMRMI